MNFPLVARCCPIEREAERWPPQILPCFPYWVTTMTAINYLQATCAIPNRCENPPALDSLRWQPSLPSQSLPLVAEPVVRIRPEHPALAAARGPPHAPRAVELAGADCAALWPGARGPRTSRPARRDRFVPCCPQ